VRRAEVRSRAHFENGTEGNKTVAADGLEARKKIDCCVGARTCRELAHFY
jgi:hypothetical protein